MITIVLFLGLAVQCVFGGCNVGWVENKGYCYSFSDHELNFFNAAAMCNVYGGNLIQVDSAEKQAWLDAQLAERKISEVLIGGSSLNHKGVFKWVPSEKQIDGGYTNWYPGDPNNHDTERCIYIYQGSKWINVDCVGRLFKYVCEKRLQDVFQCSASRTD
ncbi:hypothetical protein BsWGS_23788 [Bradybaena similaris]